jgi:hypothetical protein
MIWLHAQKFEGQFHRDHQMSMWVASDWTDICFNYWHMINFWSNRVGLNNYITNKYLTKNNIK